jgi:hypothetical protein
VARELATEERAEWDELAGDDTLHLTRALQHGAVPKLEKPKTRRGGDGQALALGGQPMLTPTARAADEAQEATAEGARARELDDAGPRGGRHLDGEALESASEERLAKGSSRRLALGDGDVRLEILVTEELELAASDLLDGMAQEVGDRRPIFAACQRTDDAAGLGRGSCGR